MINSRKLKYSNIDILKYFLKKRHLSIKIAVKIYDAETNSINFDECFRSTEIFRVVDEALKYIRFLRLEVRGEISESSYLSPIRKNVCNFKFEESQQGI